jgi:hypothetical protein
MALAHRRPVYGRPARGLLTQRLDRRHGVVSRGRCQTRRRAMDGELCTRRLTGGSSSVLHGFATPRAWCYRGNGTLSRDLWA